MQDFSQLPSRIVTEVLMLEMKMAPAAKAYLVSGFPRSMRDVVEYQEKVRWSRCCSTGNGNLVNNIYPPPTHAVGVCNWKGVTVQSLVVGGGCYVLQLLIRRRGREGAHNVPRESESVLV